MTTTENSSTPKPATIKRRAYMARQRSLAALRAYMAAPSPENLAAWHDASNAFQFAARDQFNATGTWPTGI